jgi:hypothetical protein
LQKQLAYWRRQLGGELPLLRWPNDHPRPTTETFNGTVHPFTWSKDASEVIRALKRHNEFTLFTILLSGFIALLHRYTGQNDILVGTLSPAGRKRSEAQGLLGYFLNNNRAMRFDLMARLWVRVFLSFSSSEKQAPVRSANIASDQR